MARKPGPAPTKIPHFGLLAPGHVRTKLVAARAALVARHSQTDWRRMQAGTPAAETATSAQSDWRALFRQLTGMDLGMCPHCGDALMAEPLHDADVANVASPAGAPPQVTP